MVNGEGAAVFVIESADHARRRGARPLVRITGGSSAFGASRNGHGGTHRAAIVSAIERTLREADTEPSAISHVNVHGLSTTEQDAVEAQAIHHVLGNVPVTAPKSYFGNLGAGTGAVEMAASLLGLLHREVPPTLNYDEADRELSGAGRAARAASIAGRDSAGVAPQPGPRRTSRRAVDRNG